MARQLAFAAADSDRYRFLYQAVCFSPYQVPRAQERAYAKLMDRVESIGTPKPTTIDGNPFTLYELAGGAAVMLEEEEFRVLQQLVGAIQANGVNVRKKIALEDWLSTIPEQAAAVGATPVAQEN